MAPRTTAVVPLPLMDRRGSRYAAAVYGKRCMQAVHSAMLNISGKSLVFASSFTFKTMRDTHVYPFLPECFTLSFM